MRNLCLSDKCRVLSAFLLVKCKLLRHDDFTTDELNQYIQPYFPHAMDVNVPVGKAVLNIDKGCLALNINTQRLIVNLDCSFVIEVLANPVYRTHIKARVSAKVNYDKNTKNLCCSDIKIDSLNWVDDDYALISDMTAVLNFFTPMAMVNRITEPFKNLMDTVTAGLPKAISSSAMDYLRSFTTHNKQQILTNHKAMIEQAMLSQLAKHPPHYSLNPEHWREYLFTKLGSHVSIEDQGLRFWLD